MTKIKETNTGHSAPAEVTVVETPDGMVITSVPINPAIQTAILQQLKFILKAESEAMKAESEVMRAKVEAMRARVDAHKAKVEAAAEAIRAKDETATK